VFEVKMNQIKKISGQACDVLILGDRHGSTTVERLAGETHGLTDVVISVSQRCDALGSRSCSIASYVPQVMQESCLTSLEDNVRPHFLYRRTNCPPLKIPDPCRTRIGLFGPCRSGNVTTGNLLGSKCQEIVGRCHGHDGLPHVVSGGVGGLPDHVGALTVEQSSEVRSVGVSHGDSLYVGASTKPSYWRTAVGNLRALEHEMSAPSLFDELTEAQA
jgi:hypothetical protein